MQVKGQMITKLVEERIYSNYCFLLVAQSQKLLIWYINFYSDKYYYYIAAWN